MDVSQSQKKVSAETHKLMVLLEAWKLDNPQPSQVPVAFRVHVSAAVISYIPVFGRKPHCTLNSIKLKVKKKAVFLMVFISVEEQ
jgi:hypothetical protein